LWTAEPRLVDLSAKTTRQTLTAMDFFVVPTIGFKLLYGFVIIRLIEQRSRLDAT